METPRKKDIPKKQFSSHYLIHDSDVAFRASLFSSILLMFCLELWYERNFQKNHLYYLFFIGTCLSNLLILWRFNSEEFIRDLEEIALMELLTQIVFLILHLPFWGHCVLNDHLECLQFYKTLNSMFMLLYSVRIFWLMRWGKENILYSWPIIGVLGWYAKRKRPDVVWCNTNWVNSLLAYLLIASSFKLTQIITKFASEITNGNPQLQEVGGIILVLFVIVTLLIPAVMRLCQQSMAFQNALYEERKKNHVLTQANWRLRNDVRKIRRVGFVNTLEEQELLNDFAALDATQKSAISRQIKALLAKLLS